MIHSMGSLIISFDWENHINALSTAIIALFTILTWRIYKAMLRASKITERS
jgi:hypothetical protein